MLCNGRISLYIDRISLYIANGRFWYTVVLTKLSTQGGDRVAFKVAVKAAIRNFLVMNKHRLLIYLLCIKIKNYFSPILKSKLIIKM